MSLNAGGIEPCTSRMRRFRGSAEAHDMLLAPSGPATALLSGCDLRMLQAPALAYCPPAELFDDTADFLLQHTRFVRSAQRREGAAKRVSPGRVRHQHDDAESLERH